MTIEFDHFFIFTGMNAPEADAALDLGLREGSSNVHPGQGTANRRIFFHNAMLEFLWVHDEEEVRSERIAPSRLWERSQHKKSGYSPFGVAFRSTTEPGDSTPLKLPFDAWPFRPPYLPDHLHIDVAQNDAYPSEPMLFTIPFGSRPDAAPPDRRQPLDHPLGLTEITAVNITVSHAASLSPATQAVAKLGLIAFETGPAHLAEIVFDDGQQGQSTDFRPALPLIFRW